MASNCLSLISNFLPLRDIPFFLNAENPFEEQHCILIAHINALLRLFFSSRYLNVIGVCFIMVTNTGSLILN